MQLETKFLRLRAPVTIGSYFGEWRVTWAGGWTRDRLSYLVMVVRVASPALARRENRGERIKQGYSRVWTAPRPRQSDRSVLSSRPATAASAESEPGRRS
jgi:hypothetical protein